MTPIIDKFKEQMLSVGWCLVDTTSCFKNWKKPDRTRSECFVYSKNTANIAAPIQYLNFLEDLIQKGLSEEKIQLYLAEFREEGTTSEYCREEYSDDVRMWHVDGSYLRTICCLEGETTEFVAGKTRSGKNKIQKLSHFHTLFLTAENRVRKLGIKGTVHRAPQKIINPRRNLIVTSFEPKETKEKN